MNGQRASVTATYESSRPNLENAADGVPIAMPTPPPASHYAMNTLYQPHPSYFGGIPNYGNGPDSARSMSHPGMAHSTNGSPTNGHHNMGGNEEYLSRSHSSATLDSSDSSGGADAFGASQSQSQSQPPSQHQQQGRSQALDPDLVDGNEGEMAGGIILGRQRARSSPRSGIDPSLYLSTVEPGSLDPASGRAPRTLQAAAGLHRQNSYHAGNGGAPSPSPRRPTSLHRTNSSTSSASHKRGNRPTSLAASAFGLTPMTHDDTSYASTPQHSPSTSSNMSHFPTNGMNGLHIVLPMTSAASSQSTSNTGQPTTPSTGSGLFTSNSLEQRQSEMYYIPTHASSTSGLDAQYGYGYGGAYGSHPNSACSEAPKSAVAWQSEE